MVILYIYKNKYSLNFLLVVVHCKMIKFYHLTKKRPGSKFCFDTTQVLYLLLLSKSHRVPPKQLSDKGTLNCVQPGTIICRTVAIIITQHHKTLNSRQMRHSRPSLSYLTVSNALRIPPL